MFLLHHVAKSGALPIELVEQIARLSEPSSIVIPFIKSDAIDNLKTLVMIASGAVHDSISHPFANYFPASSS